MGSVVYSRGGVLVFAVALVVGNIVSNVVASVIATAVASSVLVSLEMPALPDGQPNGTSCHQPGIPSRWPCVFIRASPSWSDQSELWPDHGGQKCHPWQLVSGTVSHWDTPGSYLALCVPMLKVSSVSGAGNPVSSSYNSPIIVYNCARGDSISMDRVRCRPSAGAH